MRSPGSELNANSTIIIVSCTKYVIWCVFSYCFVTNWFYFNVIFKYRFGYVPCCRRVNVESDELESLQGTHFELNCTIPN